jgi:prevent-host-death family protein
MKSNAARKPAPKPAKRYSKPLQVNLYEAKTQLSSLVERAAKGEAIVIAKAGKPIARLVPASQPKPPDERLPFGQNLLGIEFLSDDWEQDLPPEWFEDPEGDKLLRLEKSK